MAREEKKSKKCMTKPTKKKIAYKEGEEEKKENQFWNNDSRWSDEWASETREEFQKIWNEVHFLRRSSEVKQRIDDLLRWRFLLEARLAQGWEWCVSHRWRVDHEQMNQYGFDSEQISDAIPNEVLAAAAQESVKQRSSSCVNRQLAVYPRRFYLCKSHRHDLWYQLHFWKQQFLPVPSVWKRRCTNERQESRFYCVLICRLNGRVIVCEPPHCRTVA